MSSGRVGRRRWRRWRRRLAFSLLPVAALLLAAEGAARLSGAGVSAGGPTGWTLAPGLESHRIEQPPPMVSFSVSTNADGLRTDRGRARTPGVRRLITFGDSTVFGWGLPQDGAPAGVIEAALGGGWELINAGQPGFSSEQARRLAALILPLYRPDGVIWFHPWHDLRGAVASDRALLPSAPTWWSRSALLRLLAAPTVAPPRQNALMPFASDELRGGVPRVPPAQRAENLAAIRDLAAAQGAWTLAVLLPSDRALEHAGPSPLSEELSGVSASLGIPFVDPTQTLSGRPLSEITLPGDTGHFTAAANALLMAPVIAEIRAMEGG